MTGWKFIPWLLCGTLAVAALVGANLLPAEQAAPNAPAVKPAAPAASDGLVAKGTVQSDPPPLSYGLPANMAAGRIEKILVKDGQEVKAGDVLYQFDESLLQKDVTRAEAAYNVAYQTYQGALAKQAQYAGGKDLKQLAVTDATQKRDQAQRALDISKDALEKTLAIEKDLTDAEKQNRRRNDLNVFRAESMLADAKLMIDQKKLELDAYTRQADELTAAVQQAKAACVLAKEDGAKAELAVAECTVKAKAGGVIEQISASPGSVVYPQTRPPVLILVPSGRRVVWAEIVPEFAHKIRDRVGQKVVVSDDSNTHLTYEGTVNRICSAFLPKANGGGADLLNGKTNVVLMVEIEVTDATPVGKSPLRVGQPVRVTFP